MEFDPTSLGTLNYRELQDLCKKHGIKANQKKVVLISELKKVYEQHQNEGEKNEDVPTEYVEELPAALPRPVIGNIEDKKNKEPLCPETIEEAVAVPATVATAAQHAPESTVVDVIAAVKQLLTVPTTPAAAAEAASQHQETTTVAVVAAVQQFLPTHTNAPVVVPQRPTTVVPAVEEVIISSVEKAIVTEAVVTEAVVTAETESIVTETIVPAETRPLPPQQHHATKSVKSTLAVGKRVCVDFDAIHEKNLAHEPSIWERAQLKKNKENLAAAAASEKPEHPAKPSTYKPYTGRVPPFAGDSLFSPKKPSHRDNIKTPKDGHKERVNRYLLSAKQTSAATRTKRRGLAPN